MKVNLFSESTDVTSESTSNLNTYLSFKPTLNKIGLYLPSGLIFN